ncbi:MAG: hypothetical protein ABJJ69_21565 [Paracoccaceae bacterium]
MSVWVLFPTVRLKPAGVAKPEFGLGRLFVCAKILIASLFMLSSSLNVGKFAAFS